MTKRVVAEPVELQEHADEMSGELTWMPPWRVRELIGARYRGSFEPSSLAWHGSTA